MSFTLKETLLVIANRIQSNRTTYSSNEALVKNNLINPILSALEWNLENPEDVVLEQTDIDDVPDYVLKSKGMEKLIVEAKKLGSKETEKNERQLLRYCININFKLPQKTLGVLTDGEDWKLFDSTKKEPAWHVNIKEHELEYAVDALSTINKFGIDNASDKVKEFKSKYPYALEKKILPQAPMEKIIVNLKEKGRRALDILLYTAERLIKDRRLTAAQCPIPTCDMKKINRYLVNKTPVHPNGNDFFSGKKLSNGLYLETAFNKSACKRYAKYLLKKFRYPEDILVVIE